MLDRIFKTSEKILRVLQENGYEAYIVGGAVRDFLLGREVQDIDVTTSAEPTIVQQLFSKTIPVGIEHGTVIVRLDEQSFEVTTFRQEFEYLDYRRPSKVSFWHHCQMIWGDAILRLMRWRWRHQANLLILLAVKKIYRRG